MAAEVNAKIRLIKEINTVLTLYGKEPVTPSDFDILYDMSLEELTLAKKELYKKLRTIVIDE